MSMRPGRSSRLPRQITWKPPKRLPGQFKRAAKAAMMFTVSSFRIRPTSSNNRSKLFFWRRGKRLKLPPLQFLEKIFQKGVTFLLYQVSIVVYVDFLHHPTFPREATRGDFFCQFAHMMRPCLVAF